VVKYFVEKSVFFVYMGPQIVFLDLKRNKYWAIDRQQAAALNGVVEGWNAPTVSTVRCEEHKIDPSVRKRVTRELLERKVLTRSRGNGKRAAPTQTNLPTEEILAEYEVSIPPIGPLEIVRFVRAYLSALVMRRFWSLARIADRAGRRKQNVGQMPQSRSVAELRELILVYTYIRPFFFRAHDNCLLDSLVLIEFLRYHDVYPTWVFGVSTSPFLAHTWLEIDGVVLNDSALRLGSYSPVFAQ